MRKLAIVLLASAFAGPALGADLALKAAPSAFPYGSSGWYWGIGSLAATTNAEVTVPTVGSGNITTVGAGIGPVIGYHQGDAVSFKAVEAAIYWQNLGGSTGFATQGSDMNARFSGSARFKFGGVGVISSLGSFLPNLGLTGVFPPTPVSGQGNLPYLSIGADVNQVQASIIGVDTSGWQVTPTFGMGFISQVMDVNGKPTGYVTDTSVEYTPAGKGMAIGGDGGANLGRKFMARFAILR